MGVKREFNGDIATWLWAMRVHDYIWRGSQPV